MASWDDIPEALWHHIMTTYIQRNLFCVAAVCREWHARLPGPYRSFAFESISIHDLAGRPNPDDYELVGSTSPVDVILRFQNANEVQFLVEGAAEAGRLDVVKELYRRIPIVDMMRYGIQQAFRNGYYEMASWIMSYTKYDEDCVFYTMERCVFLACLEHWDMVLRLAHTYKTLRYFALSEAIREKSTAKIDELFLLFDDLDARAPWDKKTNAKPYLQLEAVFTRNMDVLHCLRRHNIIESLSYRSMYEYLDSGCVRTSDENFTATEDWIEENFP